MPVMRKKIIKKKKKKKNIVWIKNDLTKNLNASLGHKFQSSYLYAITDQGVDDIKKTPEDQHLFGWILSPFLTKIKDQSCEKIPKYPENYRSYMFYLVYNCYDY